MIIVMNQDAPQAAIDRVVAEIERMGSQAHLSRGQFRTVIGAIGEEGAVDPQHLQSLEGVEKVVLDEHNIEDATARPLLVYREQKASA